MTVGNMAERYEFRSEMELSDVAEVEKCISHFCKNGIQSLNHQDFKELISSLLTDSDGESYEMSDDLFTDLFLTFDRNEDERIDVAEFSVVWKDFISPLVKPVTALLIIDVQNDFIDGSLALKNCPATQDANDVIPVINNLLENSTFDVVVYSIDYHPEDHISFFENINLYKLSEENENVDEIKMLDTVSFDEPFKMTQKLWPAHCVQDTWGCELHKDLKQVDNSFTIHKGENSKVDSYSAFFDNMKGSSTVLHEELKKRNVTHVFVCGVAFDFCVAFTALDALELGYATTIIEDAVRGTDDDNIANMKEKLISHNCVMANSDEVESLINGKDRKVEFASTIADAIKKG